MSGTDCHGTKYGYCNRGCRCDVCREAWRLLCGQRRKQRHAARVLVDGVLVHPDAPHGRYTTYSNYGCRCEPCSDAWRDYYGALAKRQRRAS